MGVKIGPGAAALSETTASKQVNSTRYTVVSSDFNSDKCILTLHLDASGGAKEYTITNGTGIYLLYTMSESSGVLAPGASLKQTGMFYIVSILKNYVSLVGGILTSEILVREVA